MNEIVHKKLTINFDVWHPQAKLADVEIDMLIAALKTKTLLAHCGNVKLTISEEAAHD